ncbi:hypothetical protein [Brumimicrobium oceani]|uniref:Uncharacterized protein n=1 Tax=Brumimicrobium oceani TaxID=2100725 RepID=A0A2U2XGK0_9FLAO|nr:hypothetical protein [Brumimicrobium oceani]PWH86928.1 hypothetical protein DIT68_01320 [Brumimicrobium oceani]
MTLVTVSVAYSQVYEGVYENSNEEVRARLDQNKISGIDILTDVVAHHEFKVASLDDNKRTKLFNLAKSNQYTEEFLFNEELNSFTLLSSAHMTKEMIVDLIESSNLTLVEYAVVYSIVE